MGWIKDAKANMLSTEAARAREEGRAVFAPMLNTPITQSSSMQTSGAVSGWAEMIEAVEAEGWTMVHWSVAADQKGRPQAYPLFRPAR